MKLVILFSIWRVNWLPVSLGFFSGVTCHKIFEIKSEFKPVLLTHHGIIYWKQLKKSVVIVIYSIYLNSAFEFLSKFNRPALNVVCALHQITLYAISTINVHKQLYIYRFLIVKKLTQQPQQPWRRRPQQPQLSDHIILVSTTTSISSTTTTTTISIMSTTPQRTMVMFYVFFLFCVSLMPLVFFRFYTLKARDERRRRKRAQTTRLASFRLLVRFFNVILL